MTDAQLFQRCLEQAKKIVSAYRAEAPEGCDPQNTWALVVVGAGTAISAGTAAYSANQKSKAEKKAREDAMGVANSSNFGQKPEAALYEPVDFNEEQLAAIRQNWESLGANQELVSGSNAYLTQNDIRRATKLIPNFRDLLRIQGENTHSLMSGELPYDDVLGVVANRSSLTNATGIPGSGANATMRDLGLSRLDAIKAGGGMMQQMVQQAETLSPINRYMKPQDNMMSPSERIRLAMTQNEKIQESQQSANNLVAGISPSESVRNSLALQNSLNPVQQPDYASIIGSSVGSLLTSYGGSRMGGTAADPSTGLQRNGYYNSAGAAMQAYGATPNYTPAVKRYYSGYSLGA